MMKRILVALFALALGSSPCAAAITATNIFATIHQTTTTSAVATATGACAVGNMIVFVVKFGSVTTGLGFSDARGNTYSIITNQLYNTSQHGVFATAPVTTGIQVGDTMTAAWTSGQQVDYSAVCVAGQSSSSPQDKTGETITGTGQTGNSTGPTGSTVNSGTLAQADELLIGLAFPEAFIGSFTHDATNGWTETNGGNNPSGSRQLDVETKVVSATTAINFAPAFTSGQWYVAIWSLKAAGGAAVTANNLLTMGVGN